jgi:hypothetical protein
VGTPVLDRRTIEQLFAVRRRRANELMARFGGYRSGNTYLIERELLVFVLQRIAETGEVAYEIARRQKIADELAILDSRARARAVRLPVRQQGSAPLQLPPDITVCSGKLIVGFETVEELFARLYELAQAAAIDFERARLLIEKRA